MPTWPWSQTLAMDLPVMDETHREFVNLLGDVEESDSLELLVRWSALVAHTQQHFHADDSWMRDTHFASSNCHTVQHRLVLHLRRVGYDTATGIVHLPQALPTEVIRGCAGEACSDTSPLRDGAKVA